MQFFKKIDVWWVELHERDFVRRRCTHEKSIHRARAVARMFELRQYSGEGVARLREMTLGDAINRYVETVLLQKRQKPTEELRKSAKNDLLRLRKIEEFFGFRERLAAVVKAEAIADFNYSLIHEMKPGSANRYLTILRAVLFKAHEWGALRVRPSIKMNPASPYRSRFLDDREEQKLIDHCSPELRDYVIFLLDTGARKQEALKLRWSDVDLRRYPQPAVTFNYTKNGEPRTVSTSARLRRRPASRRSGFGAFNGRYQCSVKVVAGPRNQQKPRQLNRLAGFCFLGA